jgi:glucosamine--fructose-6-phosphate aminotransferase (isomerizing)
MSLNSEIFEQPYRLENLLNAQRKNVQEIAKAIKSRGISYVFLAARGTSDNAGRYANYLLGAKNRLPLALATPSLFTYYRLPPVLKGALVVGISQSGQSPDIVSVLQEGKKQGCLTLAITNEPNSPLAAEADFTLNTQAGPELAIAATKTYTAELMSIAMLSAALNEDKSSWQALEKVPAWVSEALKHDQRISEATERYRYMQQCVILGRGYNYSTVFEWALKMKELAYVEADPYSSADFQHGPIAIVARGFPVMTVIMAGQVADSLMPVLIHLKNDLLAELVVISNLKEALSMGKIGISIAEEIPEYLTPLVSIVPAQLFSYHLTQAKGFDPEKPRSIQKITETR